MRRYNLMENRFRRIIHESVKSVLNEMEGVSSLEQAVEKCRRSYRNYRMCGNDAEGLCDKLSDIMENEPDNPLKEQLINKIDALREKQYNLLEFIVNLINGCEGQYGELLAIEKEQFPNADFWYGPCLTGGDSIEGESFVEIFRIAMNKGKSFTEAEDEYYDQEAARREASEEWDRTQEQNRLQRLRDVAGENWIDDYEAPANFPLKVVGKIQLSDKDLNKKRW